MPFFSHDTWNEERPSRIPALGRLFETTKGCMSENFWDYDSFFEEFFSSNFLSEFLQGELSKIANEKDYDAVQSDDELELVLGEGFRISMGKLKAGTSSAASYSEIICYASDFMCVNLGPCALDVELFKLPSGCNVEVFDRSIRPIAVGRKDQAIGEILRARAGVDVLRFSPPAHDTFQLYAVSLKPRMPLLWHFDAISLDAKYCTSANLMSSRVQTGIDILVRMDRKDAIPEIIQASKSKDHFVRWTAISSVVCMDEVEGVRLLRDALNDPHPDVSSAARKALEILFPGS
ncbi:HEAT repeat domain-containing protein [Bradyrhizobium liaoningense]|uniref:HEAT repeat domain-containing protein n=1 Tax=Bradyrhizobium liaoningense TaxID=43992 RepID=UPI001BA52CFD|nr:HEAT repeat domain-containing protein [Bradyrhizobium liaoningense]MBR0820279.1 HEAT repeat domain-containing protein [Bradyrhizobium liaoningense]